MTVCESQLESTFYCKLITLFDYDGQMLVFSSFDS
jgi:hypothetical protein